MDICFGTMFLTLFLMIDSVGNTASFHEVLKGVPPKNYWKVLIRELLIALAFMLVINQLGSAILNQLEVSEITVRLTTGLILLLSALWVLFASPRNIRQRVKPEENPFIVPLAVPLMASPAVLAIIMLYSHISEDYSCRLYAILAAWTLSSLVLLVNRAVVRFLGQNGLLAFERLLALILVMLAIQQILLGVELFQTTYLTK